MTMNFKAVVSKNPAIGQEVARTGRMVNTVDEFPSFLRKKSQRTKGQEAITLKYESRKNMCPNCFTSVSLTGECGQCD